MNEALNTVPGSLDTVNKHKGESQQYCYCHGYDHKSDLRPNLHSARPGLAQRQEECKMSLLMGSYKVYIAVYAPNLSISNAYFPRLNSTMQMWSCYTQQNPHPILQVPVFLPMILKPLSTELQPLTPFQQALRARRLQHLQPAILLTSSIQLPASPTELIMAQNHP